MKKTNQQQWDEAQLILNSKKEAFINETFNGKDKHNVVYEADAKGINAIEISSIKVHAKVEPSYYKKPTAKDIAALWDYIEAFENTEKEIFIHYTRKYEAYSSSGAFKLSQIGEGRLSFYHDDLIPIHKELNEKYAPRDGYSPCAYCRKQVPNETLIKKKIIGRGRKQVWNSWKSRYESKACITEEYLEFCSATCAGHEQMSREG